METVATRRPLAKRERERERRRQRGICWDDAIRAYRTKSVSTNKQARTKTQTTDRLERYTKPKQKRPFDRHPMKQRLLFFLAAEVGHGKKAHDFYEPDASMACWSNGHEQGHTQKTHSVFKCLEY
nr:hypothetical protein [Pandoravirus aubagnensis]